MQEDIIAEEQKLQRNHLIKLRRAAAAEVAADTAAKACTLGWLHGNLGGDDSDHSDTCVDTYMGLLAAVLDLQQGQQTGGDPAAGDDHKQPQQLQLVQPAAGSSDQDTLRWVRQPENRKHHLRVVLECLKELAATDLPARVLLTRKVSWRVAPSPIVWQITTPLAVVVYSVVSRDDHTQAAAIAPCCAAHILNHLICA